MKEGSRIYQTKIEDIMIDEGFNARIESEGLQQHIFDLATSIAAIGIKEPLVVHLDEAEQVHLDNGHCRLAAVMLANKEMGAKIETVPARYDLKSTEVERVENLLLPGGKPLNMLEQSDVIKRLLALGKTEEEIAAKGSVSITHVKNLVLLTAAPDSVRNLIIEQKVSPTNAVEAIRKFGAKADEVLTEALTMVHENGKAKVTQRNLKTKKRINWKEYGPKLRDMLHIVCFSVDTEEIRAANREDAINLLQEIQAKDN